MSTDNPTVEEVIIQLVVEAFSQQFQIEYDYSKFKIYSLPSTTTGKCAYEIVGYFDNELLVLHIYAEISKDYNIGRFELRDEINYSPTLVEKRYVALARFDDSILFFNNNFIRRSCPEFAPSDTRFNCIMEEPFINGILSESGDYIIPEDATYFIEGLS